MSDYRAFSTIQVVKNTIDAIAFLPEPFTVNDVAICCKTPIRTARYRTQLLHKHGLLEREKVQIKKNAIRVNLFWSRCDTFDDIKRGDSLSIKVEKMSEKNGNE